MRYRKIKSRTNRVSQDKRCGDSTFKVQAIKIIVECTGAIMGFQIPMLVIDRRGVSIMIGVFPIRRVAHLRVDDV